MEGRASEYPLHGDERTVGDNYYEHRATVLPRCVLVEHVAV